MADLWSMTVAAWEWMGGVVDDIWPPDNPHAADDLGDAWDKAATLLENAITRSSAVHDRLRETWPDPNGAFVQARIREANDGEFGGGGSGHRELVVSMRKMATFCHNYADQIERVRNQIWSEIIHASVEFALMAAIPGGQWLFAVRMAKRTARIMEIAASIAQAGNKLGKLGKLVTIPVREAADEVITNSFEQGLNIWQGNQDGFSWKESATNALGGAIGAPVSGIVGAPGKAIGALARKNPAAKNVLDSGLGKHATTAVSSASTNAVSSPISSHAAQSIMNGDGVPTDLAGYGQSIKDNWLTSAAIGPIRGNAHLAGEQVMEFGREKLGLQKPAAMTDMGTSSDGPPPTNPPGEVKSPEMADVGAGLGDSGAAVGQGESGAGQSGSPTAEQGGAPAADGAGHGSSTNKSTVDTLAAGPQQHIGAGSSSGQATIGSSVSQAGAGSVPQATTVGAAPATTAAATPGAVPSATATSASAPAASTGQTTSAPAASATSSTTATGTAQASAATASTASTTTASTTSAPAATAPTSSQPGAAQPGSAQPGSTPSTAPQSTAPQSGSAQPQGSTPAGSNLGTAAKPGKGEPEADRAEAAPEPDDDGPNPPESETPEQEQQQKLEQEEAAESTVDDPAGEAGGRPGPGTGQVLAAAGPAAAAAQQVQQSQQPNPAQPGKPRPAPAHTTMRRPAEPRRTQSDPPADPPRRPPGPPRGTGETPDIPRGVPSRLAAVWDLLPPTARQAITELMSSVDPDALADQVHEFAARLSPGRMDRSLGEILGEMSDFARQELGRRLAAEATVHRLWGAFPAAREAMSELLGRLHPAEAAATLARLAPLLARPPELAEAWDALSPSAREAVAGLAAKMNPDKLVKRLTDLAARVSTGPKGRSLGERVSAMSADQLAAFAEQVTAVADRIPARAPDEGAATPADLARVDRGKGLLLEAADIQAKLDELTALGVDVRAAEEGLREELGKARRVLEGNTQVPKTALDSNYENVRAKYAAADVALALARLDEHLLAEIGLPGLRITGLEVPVDDGGRAGTEARNNAGTDIDIRGVLENGTEVRFEVKDRTALVASDLAQTARQRELAGPGPKVVLIATHRIEPGFAEKAVANGADQVLQYDGFEVFIEVAATGTEGAQTPTTPPAPPPDQTPPGTRQGPPAPEPPSAAAQRFYHPENPKRDSHPMPGSDLTDAELASSRHSERALRALIGKSRLAWNDLRLLLLEHGLLPADSRPLRLRDVERILDGARVRARIAPALRAAFDNAIQEFERLARGEAPTVNSESSRNRAWQVRKEIRDGSMTPGRRERFIQEIFADDVLARQQEILGERFGRFQLRAGVAYGLDGRGENGDGRSHYAGSTVPALTLDLHPSDDPRTPGSPVVVQSYHLNAGTEPSALDVHRDDTFTRALFEPEILLPTTGVPPNETRPEPTERARWFDRITFTGLHVRKGIALITALIEAGSVSRPQQRALTHALEGYARAAARLDERLPDVKWLVQRGIELTSMGQDQLIDVVALAYGMSPAMVAALVTDPSVRSRVPRELMPSIQELADFSEVLAKARTQYEELLRQTEKTARELEFAEREWQQARDAALEEMQRIGDEAVANGLPEWARRDAAAGLVAELRSVATRARVSPEADPAVPEPVRRRGWSVRDLAGTRAALAAATRAVEEARYAAEVAYHAAMAELRAAREDVRALTEWVPHLLAAGDRTDVAEALGLPVESAAAHRLLPGAEPGLSLDGTTEDVQARVRAEVAARQDRLERATERMRLADTARTEAHAEYVRALVPAIEQAAGRGLSNVEIARIAKLLDSEVAGITRRAENLPANRKPVVDAYVDARGWLLGVGNRVVGRDDLAPRRGAQFAALDPDSPDYAAKARELGVDAELADRLGKPRPVHFFHDIHMHPKGYDAANINYKDLVGWLIGQGLPNILVASPIPQSGLGVIGGSSGSFYYALTNVVRMTTVFGKKMLGLHGQLSDMRFFSARDEMSEEEKSHWFPGVSGARVDIPGVGGYLMAMAVLFGDAARYLAETTFVKEMVRTMLGRQASEVINPEWVDYFGKLIAAAELVQESIHKGRIAPEFFAAYLADGSPMAELFPVDGSPSDLTELDFYDSLLENTGQIRALLKAAGLRAELRSLPENPPEMYNPNTVELLETIAATGQVLILHDDMGLARLRGNGMYKAGPSDGRNLGPMAYLLQQERLAGARVVWAHLGIGHWTTLTVEHIERLQWLLDTTNTAMDISWNVLAQHAKADPDVKEALIQFLIRNQDRLIFGTDTVNPQPGAHYVRHRNEMDPLFAEAARRPEGAEAVTKILHGNFARLHDEAGQRVTAFVFNEILSGAWDGFLESLGGHWQRKVDGWVEARIAEGWVADPAYQPRGPLYGLDLTDAQRAKDQPWLANPQLRTMKLWYTAADPRHGANANPLRLQAVAARIAATDTAAGVKSAFDSLKRRWDERGGLRPVSGADALLSRPFTTQALMAGERIRAALAAGEISRARLNMDPGRLATLPLAPAERDAMLGSLIESVEKTEREQLAELEKIAGLRSDWLWRDVKGWAVAGAAAATMFGVGATVGLPFALSAGVSIVAGNVAFVVRGMLNIAKTGHAQSNRVSLEGMLERGRLDQRSAEALARVIRDYLEYDVNPLDKFDDILQEVRDEVEVRTRQFLIDLQAIIHTPLATGERPSQRQEDVSLEVSRYLNEVGRSYGAAPESLNKTNPHAGRLGKLMAAGLAGTFLVNLPVHVAQATSLTGLAAAVAGAYAIADGLFLSTALSNAIGGIAGYDNALRPLYRRIQNALAFPMLTVANGMLVALELSQGEWLKAVAATTLTGATLYISKLGTELELRLGRQAARKGPAALWVTASSLVGLGMMGLSSAPLVAAAGTALALSGPAIYVVRAALNKAYDVYQARTPSGIVYASNIPVLGVGAAIDLSLPRTPPAPKLIEPSQPDKNPDDPDTPDDDPGGTPSPEPTPPTPPRPAGPSNRPDPGTNPPGTGPVGLATSDSLPLKGKPDSTGVRTDARRALGRAVPDAGMRAVERPASGSRYVVTGPAGNTFDATVRAGTLNPGQVAEYIVDTAENSLEIKISELATEDATRAAVARALGAAAAELAGTPHGDDFLSSTADPTADPLLSPADHGRAAQLLTFGGALAAHPLPFQRSGLSAALRALIADMGLRPTEPGAARRLAALPDERMREVVRRYAPAPDGYTSRLDYAMTRLLAGSTSSVAFGGAIVATAPVVAAAMISGAVARSLAAGLYDRSVVAREVNAEKAAKAPVERAVAERAAARREALFRPLFDRWTEISGRLRAGTPLPDDLSPPRPDAEPEAAGTGNPDAEYVGLTPYAVRRAAGVSAGTLGTIAMASVGMQPMMVGALLATLWAPAVLGSFAEAFRGRHRQDERVARASERLDAADQATADNERELAEFGHAFLDLIEARPARTPGSAAEPGEPSGPGHRASPLAIFAGVGNDSALPPIGYRLPDRNLPDSSDPTWLSAVFTSYLEYLGLGVIQAIVGTIAGGVTGHSAYQAAQEAEHTRRLHDLLAKVDEHSELRTRVLRAALNRLAETAPQAADRDRLHRFLAEHGLSAPEPEPDAEPDGDRPPWLASKHWLTADMVIASASLGATTAGFTLFGIGGLGPYAVAAAAETLIPLVHRSLTVREFAAEDAATGPADALLRAEARAKADALERYLFRLMDRGLAESPDQPAGQLWWHPSQIIGLVRKLAPATPPAEAAPLSVPGRLKAAADASYQHLLEQPGDLSTLPDRLVALEAISAAADRVTRTGDWAAATGQTRPEALARNELVEAIQHYNELTENPLRLDDLFDGVHQGNSTPQQVRQLLPHLQDAVGGEPGEVVPCQVAAVLTDRHLADRAAGRPPGRAVPPRTLAGLTGREGWADRVAMAARVAGAEFVPMASANDVAQRLRDLGSGARAIVHGERAGVTHLFNVANLDGEIYFIDGQRNLFAELTGYRDGLRLLITEDNGEEARRWAGRPVPFLLRNAYAQAIASAREQFARLHKDPAAPKGIDDVINPEPSTPDGPERADVPPSTGGRRWKVYRDIAALTRGMVPPSIEPGWHRHTRGLVTAATNIVNGPPAPPSGLMRWVSLIETAYGMVHNARQLSAGATYNPELVRWAQEHPEALKYFRMPELSPLARTSDVNALPAIHAGVVTPAEQAWQIAKHHPLLPQVNPNFKRPDAYREGWRSNGPQAVVGYFHGTLGKEMKVEPVRPEDVWRVDGMAYVAEEFHGTWEAHDSYDSVIDAIYGEWWSPTSPSPLPPIAALRLTYTDPRSGVIVEKWGQVRWTEGGVVFLSPVPGTLMLLPENPLSISLLPITYGEAGYFNLPERATRAVTPPAVPDQPARPADPGQVARALGELDSGRLAELELPGLVIEGVDPDRPAILQGTLADGTAVRIDVVTGVPGFDAFPSRIIRDRAVAPPGTRLVYLFAEGPTPQLAEGLVGIGADVVLRQEGTTDFAVVAARDPGPAPDLFSRRAVRGNQDILDSGDSLPRTQETVARTAAAAGIDLSGVDVQLVETPEVIEFLDEVGACAATPPELAGKVIWLGPASFADVETLVAVLAHEMTHVRQLRAGVVPTEQTRESLEDEAQASEEPALERFRDHDDDDVRGAEDLRPAGPGRDPGGRPVAARHAGERFGPPAPDDGREDPDPRPGIRRPEPAGDRPPDHPDRPARREAGDPGIDADGSSPDFLNLPPDPSPPVAPRIDAVINQEPLPPLAEPEPEPDENDRVPIAEIPGPLYRDEPLPASELRATFRGEDDPNDPDRAFAPQVVEYFSPERREEHRVFVRDGKLYWAKDGSLVDTSGGDPMARTGPFDQAIFAMDPQGNLYVSMTWVMGQLHHSSFLAGQPVAVAGHIKVVNGRLIQLTRQSGHYQPEKEQLQTGLGILAEQGVDVSQVDTGPQF
ncbi:toxin glutamine deamidase domain-containing protein [Amycolatopsis sp. lyj-112]|uniref:WXG100-like domain-containing protein n=1 Tax=Amycolatopsis sp. lyj-112 TaxID=2789288 RepID=UPI00397BC205